MFIYYGLMCTIICTVLTDLQTTCTRFVSIEIVVGCATKLSAQKFLLTIYNILVTITLKFKRVNFNLHYLEAKPSKINFLQQKISTHMVCMYMYMHAIFYPQGDRFSAGEVERVVATMKKVIERLQAENEALKRTAKRHQPVSSIESENRKLKVVIDKFIFVFFFGGGGGESNM